MCPHDHTRAYSCVAWSETERKFVGVGPTVLFALKPEDDLLAGDFWGAATTCECVLTDGSPLSSCRADGSRRNVKIRCRTSPNEQESPPRHPRADFSKVAFSLPRFRSFGYGKGMGKFQPCGIWISRLFNA